MTKLRKSISQKSEKEVEELLSIWKPDNNYFSMTLIEMVDFSEKIKITKKTIEESINPRLVILATWILIDFTIRHILKTGLELDRFESKNVSLLPINTRDCIEILKSLVKDQKEKPINPSRNAILIPGSFAAIIYKDKDFFKKFTLYQEEWDKENNVQYDGGYKIIINNPKYRNVKDTWFNKTIQIEDSWYKEAEKINKVRNFAVHNFEEESIYDTLGINGEDSLENLKIYCYKTLTTLIGLK